MFAFLHTFLWVYTTVDTFRGTSLFETSTGTVSDSGSVSTGVHDSRWVLQVVYARLFMLQQMSALASLKLVR